MDLLSVSHTLLWLLVTVLAVTVFALARQIGVLNERIAPAGALTPTSGPKIGEMTEIVNVENLEGEHLQVGGDQVHNTTLILFVSPTCPVCKSLVPIAESVANHDNLTLLFASDGDTRDRHQKYVVDLALEPTNYILSQPLGIQYGVSKLPFAVLIGSGGILAAKGLVNTREHLESLLEAMHTGISTLQEYVGQQDGWQNDSQGRA